MRRLAQYLLAGACSSAATAAALAASGPAAPALSYDDAVRAFAALETGSAKSVLDEPQLHPVVAKCTRALTARLARPGGALLLARDPELNAAWCGLPLGAVELIVAASAAGEQRLVEVDCEETVLLLLQRWAAANSPSAGQCRRLRRLLRPLRLCPGYLHDILPRLSWVGLTQAEAADLAFAAAALAGASGWAPDADAWKACALRATFGPSREPQWLQLRGPGGGRTTTTPTDAASLTLELDLPREELEALLAEATSRLPNVGAGLTRLAHRSTPASDVGNCYLRGFEWQLGLHLVADTGAAPAEQAQRAGLYLSCKLPAGLRSIRGSPLVTSPPPVGFVLTASSAAGGAPFRANCPGCHFVVNSRRSRMRSHSWILSSNALDIAAWEPYLVNACVRMRAVVSTRGGP